MPTVEVTARANMSVKFASIDMDAVREQDIAPDAVQRREVDVFGAGLAMRGSDIGTSSGTYKEMVARAGASARLRTDVVRRMFLRHPGGGYCWRGGG